MTFASPAVLGLLILLVPLAAVLVRGERRRRMLLRRFGEARLLGRASPLPNARRRAGRDSLALLALALGLLALAGPRLGDEPAPAAHTARDLLFVLDLSRSMNAADVPPSRLAAARGVVRRVLAASPDDRVGLVVFGGSAFLQLPLTFDRTAFEQFLDAAATTMIPDPGTDLAAALEIAATAFEHDGGPAPSRAVILLSDGEDQTSRGVAEAAAALARSGARLFAVGIGTPEGAPIPVEREGRVAGYHRDGYGRVVVTRLEEEPLRWLVREIGGAYVRWDGEASEARLLAALAAVDARALRSRPLAQRAERYRWPLVLALGVLAAESWFGDRRRLDSR